MLSRFAGVAAAIVLAISTSTHAQSDASAASSMLPIASLVGAASLAANGASAAVTMPAALSVAGAELVVKTVESTARGSIYVLERASDGARASVEVTAGSVAATGKAVSAAAGTVVTVSVIGTGVLLLVAGEILAFIPNQLGRSLLSNTRLTF